MLQKILEMLGAEGSCDKLTTYLQHTCNTHMAWIFLAVF